MREIFSRESKGFDCSAYLGHGLEWPINERSDDDGYFEPISFNREDEEYDNKIAEHHAMNSVSDEDQEALLQEWMNCGSMNENNALEKDKQYYESEYNSLLKWMDRGEIIVPPPSQFADKREEIQQISLLADQAIGKEFYNAHLQWEDRVAEDYDICQDLGEGATTTAIESPLNAGREFFNNDYPRYDLNERNSICENISAEVAIQTIESHSPPQRVMSPRGFQAIQTIESHSPPQRVMSPRGFQAIQTIESHSPPQRVISPRGFQNFLEEQLVGFGEFKEEQQDQDNVFRKRRLCRHFVKGYCLRGTSCEFLHDLSIFCTDDQKVFLGGLPIHLTPEMLKTKLEEQGLTVLNKPRIMRGFTPQVCVGSVHEANKLIEQRFIFIDEHRVDVRPYQDRDKLRKGLPSVVKRSVFLGGLSDSTTGEMIVADLLRLDIKVVDIPVIKNGFAPRVVLESMEHAKMLVALKRVMVNGTIVDVRPYVNFRKRY